MSELLDGVNLRTQLAGNNRLEILMFFLNGGQHYGINVFKVHEVIQRPTLIHIPNSHPIICGVATLRGKTIPVFDLAKAVGQRPLAEDGGGNVIVTEYNRSVQGFLVRSVDRIVNINWEKVVPPPEGTGQEHFLTAIAYVDKEMIEMIDVERVLSNVSAARDEVAVQSVASLSQEKRQNHLVLVVDDSLIARNQIKKTLDKMEVESVLCKNGKEAYNQLLEWREHDEGMFKRLAMVISDIEMPEMDGYTLTAKIRSHDQLRDLYVILHTSLSGLFNNELVRRVNANAFVPKFDAGDLAREVAVHLDFLNGKNGLAA